MQKLIVISMDALVYEDLAHLKHMDSFRWMLENGALAKHVRSIYPSLTYPCHTTMATGCYPNKHGVVNNTEDTVGDADPRWLFDHKNVHCPDIFDACRAAGLTTACVGWPVTGNHPSVDYLVDECWPYGAGDIDAYRDAYLSTGTPQELFDRVVAPVLQMRVGRKQPDSSFFLTHISAEIIRQYRPDVLFMHVGNVDSFRHKTGVFSPKVEEGLDQSEQILAEIIQATKDAGCFEQTNFVVTADHGQLNYTHTVNINTLFAKEGLIDVDDTGRVTGWRAYCFPSGMSAQIHLSDRTDKTLYFEVYSLLQNACSSGLWGISKVYTADEVREAEKLDGPFSFVLETDNTASFGIDWTGPAIQPNELGECGCIRGDHGYHPSKGLRPPFIACGPSIKRGAEISDAKLVDGAPTYAAIMGVELPEADGRALTELLISGGQL